MKNDNIKTMSFTKLIDHFQQAVILYVELGSMSKEEFDSIKKEINDRYSKAKS